jgi:hypothetical protein
MEACRSAAGTFPREDRLRSELPRRRHALKLLYNSARCNQAKRKRDSAQPQTWKSGAVFAMKTGIRKFLMFTRETIDG